MNIQLSNVPISEVSTTKFLGVTIDNKLTWKAHISNTYSKLSKSIGIMKKGAKYFNRATMVTLYYTFVFPYLIYCNHIWGSTYISTLKCLFIAQKKIIRIMCPVNVSCPWI